MEPTEDLKEKPNSTYQLAIAKGQFTEQEAEMMAEVLTNLLFPKAKEFDLKAYL